MRVTMVDALYEIDEIIDCHMQCVKDEMRVSDVSQASEHLYMASVLKFVKDVLIEFVPIEILMGLGANFDFEFDFVKGE